MIRILVFIFLTNVSYLSFGNNDYQIALNKLKEASDFFEKNTLNDEQIKPVKIVLENTLQKVDSYKSEHYIAENGVLPLPVPIEVAETSLQPQNDLVLTPSSKGKKNCIYTHIAEIGMKVPAEKRIDFKRVYEELTGTKFHWKRNILDEQLFEIMGIIEKKMMDIVFDKPNILMAVKYVGLAKDMEHRFRGHHFDLNDELKKTKSRKTKCHTETLKNSDIKMSYLINNVPVAYHKIFEALVSTVFPVQIFHASAVIADKAAWNFIVRYKTSDERKKYVKKEDIDKLEGYINYMSNYFNSINLENAYKESGNKENENKENEKPKKVELKKRKTSNTATAKVPAYKKQKL